MESIACLLIGLGTLAWVLLFSPSIPGTVFVAAVATYTLARQFLLPIRAEPRKTSVGRPLTLAAAALALAADLLLVALA